MSKVPGHSGRTRIKCSMNNQCWDLQSGKLLNHSRTLDEVIAIFPENLVDLEIDVQTIHKELPRKFPSA